MSDLTPSTRAERRAALKAERKAAKRAPAPTKSGERAVAPVAIDPRRPSNPRDRHPEWLTVEQFQSATDVLESGTDHAATEEAGAGIAQTPFAAINNAALWTRGFIALGRSKVGTSPRDREQANRLLRSAYDLRSVALLLGDALREGREDWGDFTEVALDAVAVTQGMGEALLPQLKQHWRQGLSDGIKRSAARALAYRLEDLPIERAELLAMALATDPYRLSTEKDEVMRALVRDPRLLARPDVQYVVVQAGSMHATAKAMYPALGSVPEVARAILDLHVKEGRFWAVRSLLELGMKSWGQTIAPDLLATLMDAPEAETRMWALTHSAALAPGSSPPTVVHEPARQR